MPHASTHTNVLIIGAGGAGLMCAATAGKRGRSVIVLDHSAPEEIGRKILISGGGRCNFTNVGARAERYISANPHFCKSALAGFTPQDFITLVEKHRITYHEKKLGQLFCDGPAQQIVDMLLTECLHANVETHFGTTVESITKTENGFKVETVNTTYTADKLVIATGGLSIPKIGATNFGYRVAKQFDIPVRETVPALVPFTFNPQDIALYEGLSGISFDAIVSCGKVSFRENVLITHRGVSGPAILQISSYWTPGATISIRILPDLDWTSALKEGRSATPKKEVKNAIAEVLPKRFIEVLFESGPLKSKPMGQMSDKDIATIATFFENFTIKPNGTEGYRKAEVTAGGVDTNALHAATLESRTHPGLYFVGEVVDVTGWLGGYNFQWAWASGTAAGRHV